MYLIKSITGAIVLVVLAACSNNDQASTQSAEQQLNIDPISKEQSAMTKVQGIGIITAIDINTATVTVDHQAIEAIHWPAMIMAFKVADPAMLNGLMVGQKIEFGLKAKDNDQVISTIKLMK